MRRWRLILNDPQVKPQDVVLSSSQWGMLIFDREKWATSIGPEVQRRPCFKFIKCIIPDVLSPSFTFFPNQGPDLDGPDVHGLRIKISLELHYLDIYTMGVSLTLSDLWLLKMTNESLKWCPSILQHSTKLWV